MVKRYLRLILSSAVGGFVMALAAFELVMMTSFDKLVLGGFIQGFGLAIVLILNLDVYNPHVCDVFNREEENKLRCITDNIIRLVVNISIIVLMGFVLRNICLGHEGIIEAGEKIATLRYINVLGYKGDPWYDPLIGSFMCGVIVSIGCLIARKSKHEVFKAIVMFLAVGIYVVCGFEQILTNTFYFAFANALNPMTVVELIFVLIGNSLGGIAVYFISRLLTIHKN